MRLTILAVLALSAAIPAAAKIRPPAFPLVDRDPFFSIWSKTDKLTDSRTEHWSWNRSAISIYAEIDGGEYRICGDRPDHLPALEQTDAEVTASQTIYRFAKGDDTFELRFSAYTLPDDLEKLSRPLSYVTFTRRAKDGAISHPKLSFLVEPNVCTHNESQPVQSLLTSIAGFPALRMSRVEQRLLGESGDGVRINWGYFWLVDCKDFYLFAYDDVYAVSFLGNPLRGWWNHRDIGITGLLAAAIPEYHGLLAKLDAFDVDFRKRLEAKGGVKYADLAILAHRQSLAACKIVDWKGSPLMFSKENGSNGCMGTVDLLYPQLPHLLYLNPQLVRATLEPIMIYAKSPYWGFPFAPHDVGQYPLGNGQVYGMPQRRDGYPVPYDPDNYEKTCVNLMQYEETGNMLIAIAALAKKEGDASYASRHWALVKQWAEYLEQQGWDPGVQLCTDDFAGHLAHNANLSLKAIVAMRAYASLCEYRGETETAKKYTELAKAWSLQWLEAAKGGKAGGYRLAFDQPDTYSLKYNLVWDRVLGYNIFPVSVAEQEMQAYRQLGEPYGMRLDNRARYTKTDWQFWCGSLTGKRADLEFMVSPIWKTFNETPQRIPMTDWYNADDGTFVGFVGRSVVGGFFMPMLEF